MGDGNAGGEMPVGERLRRARLERGASLGDIARETKIQSWILEAIERGDLSQVPGGVFVRGYLQSYARAIGLNPADILAAYAAEQPLPAEPQPPVAEPPRPTGTPLWQTAVIAAAVITLALMWRNAARTQSDSAGDAGTESPAALQSPVSVSPASQQSARDGAEPAATAGSSVPAAAVDGAAVPPAAAPLLVELHTTGEAWIEATADGERKVYRLLDEGQTLHVEGQKQIRLLVGEAGAVRYTINGQPARPLGEAGDVRSVVISSETIGRLTNN
jgi:cytoskeletal protein RodZ